MLGRNIPGSPGDTPGLSLYLSAVCMVTDFRGLPGHPRKYLVTFDGSPRYLYTA